jgi:hypothetical protein
MFSPSGSGPHRHQLPQAGIDRIDHAAAALSVVAHAISSPPRAETVVVLLGADRTGYGIVVVNGTHLPDDVVSVVHCLLTSDPVGHHGGSMVVATVRPGGGLVAHDDERWLEMSDLAEDHGTSLLEWFVIGAETECPRDLLGEPPRWSW